VDADLSGGLGATAASIVRLRGSPMADWYVHDAHAQ
jgi:hypothetical protein